MSNTNEFRKYAVNHLGMSSNALDSYTKTLNENPYIATGMTPNVIEERQMRATVIDVFSRLMADRIAKAHSLKDEGNKLSEGDTEFLEF